MVRNKIIGKAGEDLACEILKARGYYILSRNFSCPYGEIDIIALKNGDIAFIEVKTRTSDEYGRPSEAVGLVKQRHMTRAAGYFLSRSKREYGSVDFQVIEIEVTHIRGLELKGDRHVF